MDSELNILSVVGRFVYHPTYFKKVSGIVYLVVMQFMHILVITTRQELSCALSKFLSESMNYDVGTVRCGPLLPALSAGAPSALWRLWKGLRGGPATSPCSRAISARNLSSMVRRLSLSAAVRSPDSGVHTSLTRHTPRGISNFCSLGAV